MRELLKSAARALALIILLPRIIAFRCMGFVVGRDRALQGALQGLASRPGLRGQYLRRAFLSQAINHCDATASIGFGTLISKAGSSIGENVYVGQRCHLGLVDLEKDVLLADCVQIPSGGATHGTADPHMPIRDQPGEQRCVRIGTGTWVGTQAIVLADVGCHCVVAAGAVVTKPLPDYVVAAGVPARIIRSRLATEL